MTIQHLKQILIVVLITLSTVACAPKRIAQNPLYPTKTLTAIGYGTADMFKNYSPEQRRLMSMRSSKMDAYRNLAEQIYGVHIHGHTTVSDMIVQDDSYRTYIDAFIKGARVKSMTAINTSSYETVIEITLTPQFFSCLNETEALHSQCYVNTRGHYSDNTSLQPTIASLSQYNCNSIHCYQYPDISGFYNKEF